MAIEAAAQIGASENREISGFFLRKAQFLTPINVGSALQDATEVNLHLRPTQGTYEKQMSSYEISIFTYSEDRWRECFRADVQVQYIDKVTSQVDGGNEARLEHDQISRLARRAAESCTHQITTASFYDYCAEHGIEYGNSFRLLTEIAWDGQYTSHARIDLTSARKHWQSVNSPSHPGVFDAAIHLVMAQISQGLAEPIPTLVPQRLSNVWVAASPWNQSTSSLCVSSFIKEHTEEVGSVEGSMCVVSSDGTPLCSVGHMLMSAISGPDDGGVLDQTLLYNIAWKPQLSSLSAEELLRVCDASAKVDDESHISVMEDIYSKHDTMLRAAVHHAFHPTGKDPLDLDQIPAHMRRYATALSHHYLESSRLHVEKFETINFEELVDDIEEMSPAHRAFSMVGRSLPSILRGETDPLELLFSTKAAESLYYELAKEQMRDGRFQAFLDLASHEKPALKILELGAGTGSSTHHILKALQSFEESTGQSRFSSYTYTDLSTVFFESAKEQFGDLQGRLIFQTLDLEKDPETQGYELGCYDLVIAGLVLHATSNIKATLTRVRKLLKPGGHLAFHEVTVTDNSCANVTFGVLDGWWKAEEPWRELTPLLNENQWADNLISTGFSGADLILRDYQSDTAHFCSIIISTAIDLKSSQIQIGHNHKGSEHQRILLLYGSSLGAQRNIAAVVETGDLPVQALALSDAIKEPMILTPSDIIISLLELEHTYITAITELQYKALQTLVKGVQSLLWVSAAPGDGVTLGPHSATAAGFLRSIQSEEPSKRIVTLIIESCSAQSPLSFVSKVLDSCFLGPHSCLDNEFFVRNGYLHIGRMFKEIELDTQRKSRIEPQLRGDIWNPGQPLLLDVAAPGMLDSLCFVEDSTVDSGLSNDEVEIEAGVWHVNFRDVFIALGRLGTEKLGFECAGVITRVGHSCLDDFRPGDRVVMIAAGCWRTYPRAAAEMVVKIPDDMSLQDACGSVSPGVTAFHSLANVALLQPGETILIHSGAGATGQMAIAVAKLVGAEVFTTVGFDDKKLLLMEKFGIPKDHIFYSRDSSFAKGIMRVTSGKGVDVVLNSLSGDGLRASWECVAPYGRFVEIGKADIRANSPLPMAGFAKNVSFTAVDLHDVCQTNRKLIRGLPQKVVQLLFEGKIQAPTPRHDFRVSEVEKAFRLMQSGANAGRIVVTCQELQDIVPKKLVQKSSWRFDAEATYLIVGGLGGIGRAILRWMAGKGARNLVALSRSGISSGKAAAQVVSDLEKMGVRILTPRCDVATATDDLAEVLQNVAISMPPIKGCINCAMVLQDAIFENMTFAQWSTTIRSKINSSWNLHRLLPSDMQFFILLSSLAGIYGSPGQANYAAGCAFQDALARYRTAEGHRGSVSFNLGWMRSIGIIAETEEYRLNQQNARAMKKVEDADLFALLDHFCDPFLPPIDIERTQVLVGAITQAEFASRDQVPTQLLDRPLFSSFAAPHLRSLNQNSAADEAAHDHPGARFRLAKTQPERIQILVMAMKSKLARSLSVTEEDVDPRRTLSDYGTDSLMAVELRNWFRNDFNASIAVFEIMDGSSISAIAKLVVERTEMV
ncbi:hypothetical protein N0V82_010748 [Gnomoniopsis sp. IMI 355080]|nr:hypothetical protein N0V82_010748 [Gnomoniopsis sp. IMI 355080]